MANASKITHLLGYGVYLGCTAVARLLPLKLVFLAGRGVGVVGHVLFSRRRRVAEENIRLALAKTPEEARALAREHFQVLCANMLSALKIATMSDDEILKCVSIDIAPGIGEIARADKKDHGYVAMISHMGNWEIFSHLAPLFPYYKYGAIYHKLANDYVDRHFKESRAKSGVTLFDRREGYLKCVAFIKAHGAVGVLVDQYAGLPGTWMPFFRRLTSTSTLAATLAKRADTQVVPICINTIGLAKWHVTVSEPLPKIEDPEILTALVNTEMENQIRYSPADWLWSHDRWKTPRWVFLFTKSGRRVFWPPDFDRSTLIPYRMIIRLPDSEREVRASMQAVRAIKNGRPDAHVTVVAPRAFCEALKTDEAIDDAIPVGPNDTPQDVGRLIAAADRFDAGIIFSPEDRAAQELYFGQVPYRIGPPHRFLMNDWKNPDGMGDPPLTGAERYNRIADAIGAKVD